MCDSCDGALVRDWTDAELDLAEQITTSLMCKAAAVSPYTELALAEQRLRDRLTRSNIKIARAADRWYIDEVNRAKKITDAFIRRTTERYITRWNDWGDDNAAAVRDVVELGHVAAKTVIYQRAFGAPRRAIYNGPPFESTAPKVVLEVPVEKATPYAGVSPSVTLADTRAIDQIAKGQQFWIGNYHGDVVQTQVVSISRDVLLLQGLPRDVAAERLALALGYNNGYLPVKPVAHVPTGWKGSTKQYFDGVAANAATVSRIHGSLTAMVEMGFDVYEWLNPIDERTCPICNSMNGAILEVRPAFQHVTEVIGATDPAAVMDLAPWLNPAQHAAELKAAGAGGMIDKGLGYPPAHFRCRCAIDIRPDALTRAVQVPPATKVPKKAKPVKPPVNPVKNLAGLGEAEGGVVPMDAEFIEHNAVNWRLETLRGRGTVPGMPGDLKKVEQHIIARMKISNGKLDEIEKAIRALQGTGRRLDDGINYQMKPLKQHRKPGQKGKLEKTTKDAIQIGGRGQRLETKDYIMRFVHEEGAMQGHLEIIAKTGDADKAWKIVQKGMKDLKIKNPTTVTHASQQQLAKARIIVQHDSRMGALLREEIADPDVGFKAIDKYWKRLVKENPTAEKVFKDMARKEVAPGHSAFYSETQATLAKKQGITALTHEIANPEILANILDGTGLLSSRERFMRGIFTRGMSTTQDFNSGGASSVFTRMTKAKSIRGGYDVKVILKPETLGRTDWYAYSGDQYGTTRASMVGNRSAVKELGRAANNGSNEVMFEHSISASDIDSVVVNFSTREELLAKLNKAGIKKIGGKPIEKVIVTEWEAAAAP